MSSTLYRTMAIVRAIGTATRAMQLRTSHRVRFGRLGSTTAKPTVTSTGVIPRYAPYRRQRIFRRATGLPRRYARTLIDIIVTTNAALISVELR
jgi:hypothetical protein